MNVLYTTNDLHFGGVSDVLLHSLPVLTDQINVMLLYYSENDLLRGRFEEAGVRTMQLPYRGKSDLYRTIKKTKRLIEVEQIDIVHTNLKLDKRLALPAGKWSGRKVVASLHSQNNPYARFGIRSEHYWKNWLEDIMTARLTDACLAVSRATAKNWVDHRGIPPEKTKVIHTGISEHRAPDDPDLVREAERLSAPFNRVLITACRLHTEKGLDRLIRVFDRMSQQQPGTGLIILGEGGCRPELEALAESRGLEDKLSMPGYRENIFPFLERADYYINASHSEALGLSILEAMQIGLPTLGSNVGGIPEVIEEGRNGYLIDFSEEAKAAEQIAGLLRMPDDRYEELKETTRRRFREYYTVERYVEELLTFYHNL